MPRLCVFGCAATGIGLHKFPNLKKYPEQFRIWVEIVGGKLETEADFEYYKKKRICDLHFDAKDKGNNNRLNAFAVPSHYLVGTSMAERQMSCTSSINILDIQNSAACSSNVSVCRKSIPAFEDSNQEISSNIENVNPNTHHNIKISGKSAPPLEVTSEKSSSNTENVDTRKLHLKISGKSAPPLEVANEECSCSNTENVDANKLHLKISDAKLVVLKEHSYSCVSRKIKKGAQKKKLKYNCKQMKPMQTQIKNLRSEISRLRQKGKSLISRLRNAHTLSMEKSFQQVIKNMTIPAQLFTHMQLQSNKKRKGRRFTMKEKILCLSLYKKSPKCYRLLYKYFSLPSAKCMKRLLSQVKLTTGINSIIFEKIKKTMINKEIDERLCSLMFDEMSITPHVSYNSNKDTFEGFANNKEDAFADHVIVFMVKGIKNNFKQPIAYYFTNSLNKIELKNLIKTVVKHAQENGLIILNTVCDQSAVNVGAINELVNESKANFLRRGKEWDHDLITINGQNIVPLYDVPHLIKGIRNNLLTKDMLYTADNVTKIVKWEYYQKIYAADKAFGELRLLNKITEDHINPDKINKMRVKSATQLFSHSVAVVAEHLTARGDLPEECRQVIDITLLLDNLFDSLNVSSFTVTNGKIYRGPVKNKSPHHQLWQKAKIMLNTVNFLQKKTHNNKIRITETVVPSITNLIKTINGVEALWKVLSIKYRFDAVLTRNFNQDPLENFFGNIRSYGARNVAPNTTAFESAFKALLLNNYNSPHSIKANCEEDENDCLQTLDFFLTEKITTSDVPGEEQIHFNYDIGFHETENDAGQRNYVCGWVLTKCLKNVVKGCKICKESILDQEYKNKNNDFIKLKEYANKRWLCYPSTAFEKCFEDVQNVCTSLLKDGVQRKNIKKSIELYLDVFVNFPINCKKHEIQLKKYFFNVTINLLLYSWCRSVNRILMGKIAYDGDDKIKTQARNYYIKYKKYKNKK